MVIEKVHGLHATSVSLNDRFTMLASAAPDKVASRARRRTPSGPRINHNTNIKNQALIEQIARRLEWQAKRRSLRQRLGVGPGALRRFGSESSLPGLRRANSFGNLNQINNARNRIGWRGSNGSLSRSASYSNLLQGSGRGRQVRRGFKRRGGAIRALRGRFRGGGVRGGGVRGGGVRGGGVRGGGVRGGGVRGGGVRGGGVRGGGVRGGRVSQRQLGAGRGRGAARGRGVGRGGGGQARGGRGRGGAMRGRGRGGRGAGVSRRGPAAVPSKEELDLQLDQYMASSKHALDQQLEEYMKTAIEME